MKKSHSYFDYNFEFIIVCDSYQIKNIDLHNNKGVINA